MLVIILVALITALILGRYQNPQTPTQMMHAKNIRAIMKGGAI